jgi:uracil-DNA glycosylase
MAMKRGSLQPSLFDAAEPAGPIVLPQLPADWLTGLGPEFSKPYYRQLQQFIDDERARHTIFPPTDDVFNALILTPLSRVRVLILGQDPYHDDGQAHGLCFSVRPGVAPPPSLKNIFRELRDDLGCNTPDHGCLTSWAEQGVLLLNTVLTVRAHEPASHKGRGWEEFTDAVIKAVNAKSEPVVFVFWGAQAQKKAGLIDARRHTILQSAHPSPLSASNGFFGSRPFSKINTDLKAHGLPEIEWQLPGR